MHDLSVLLLNNITYLTGRTQVILYLEYVYLYVGV